MGRSVRGEKDYSVIVAIGSDLIKLLRDRHSRDILSPQMRKQIEIGLEITELARQEIQSGADCHDAFEALVQQCLRRDDGWKAFYVEKMDEVVPTGPSAKVLDIYAAELEAEQAFIGGHYAGAADKLQRLIDSKTVEGVIVHELANLAESNHMPRFWSIVRAHTPTMEKAEAWLKEHGQILEEDI